MAVPMVVLGSLRGSTIFRTNTQTTNKHDMPNTDTDQITSPSLLLLVLALNIMYFCTGWRRLMAVLESLRGTPRAIDR
ncbi:hypothetical protein J6590_036704 [Homalodisca vitripennis]|nr:hypothetical protein J6590_036704 [Homalodisca vitripennis]